MEKDKLAKILDDAFIEKAKELMSKNIKPFPTMIAKELGITPTEASNILDRLELAKKVTVENTTRQMGGKERTIQRTIVGFGGSK